MGQLVDLKVGFSCNNNCIHCVISDKTHEKDLSFDEIKMLVEGYINDYKEIQLTLTGGEISIRKDFVRIMEFIKQKKSEGKITFVDMQTNARMFSNQERALVAAETVDFFLIALHSSESETHDKITKSNGSFEQTTKAIRNVIKCAGREKIAIQTVINRLNIEHLADIYKYVNEEFSIKECNITFPHPIGKCISAEVVPSYELAQKHINDALQYCLSNKIYPYIEAIPLCVFWPGMNREYASEFLERRNIDVVGYGGEKDGQVNYAQVFDEGHLKYDTCTKCQYFKKCEGVWKEHKYIYPDENMYKLLLNGEEYTNGN